MLDSRREYTDAIDQLFSNRFSVDSIRDFIADPHYRQLIVSKRDNVNRDVSTNQSEARINDADEIYRLSIEVRYVDPRMISFVVLKRGLFIESSIGYDMQLHIINLVDSSPCGTLHAYLSRVIEPYFTSYVRQTSINEW
jgi:hypothetical protein